MELVSVDHKLQFPLLAFLWFNSNIYLQLWVNKNVIYFSGNQQSIISFIKIKSLTKTLLSLNFHTYPKIQEPILPDFKKCCFLLAGVYCICWFWGMVMYGNEFKAKGNSNWTTWKRCCAHSAVWGCERRQRQKTTAELSQIFDAIHGRKIAIIRLMSRSNKLPSRSWVKRLLLIFLCFSSKPEHH